MDNGEPQDVDVEDIVDDVLGGGDVIDDFYSLKGMISGALGSLGYKFTILVVLLFSFVYTVYNAFNRSTQTEVSVVSFNNCSCNPRDRAFYIFTTFGFMALWIVFLAICALYHIWKLCCPSNHMHEEDSSKEKRLIPDKHHDKFLKRELKKLTAMILSLNKKNLHSDQIDLEIVNLTTKTMLDFMMHPRLLEVWGPLENSTSFDFVYDDICKLFKGMLVVTRFTLWLPIVPLLLVQWLDEYSWNCVVGSIKDYCKETTVGYMFDQSMFISFLYVCILLSYILGILLKIMPVDKLLSKQDTSRSKRCLPFQITHTLFLTNVNFIVIIALIYTSVLSQFTYIAATETERDINSGRTFNFGETCFNQSITGGVSNSVLWKCSEGSSARNFKVFFLTLLTFLIIITISFAAVSLVMTFCNYQKFNKLISHYYIARIKPEFRQHVNFFGIAMTLHNLFQQMKPKISQGDIKSILRQYWDNPSTRNSRRWYGILFLIPAVEFILILILFLLVLTSYNVYPIGCFFNDVHYDESTSTVMLDLAEGVYIYQQIAVVVSIAIFFILIFVKVLHICLAVRVNTSPSDIRT